MNLGNFFMTAGLCGLGVMNLVFCIKNIFERDYFIAGLNALAVGAVLANFVKLGD